MTSYGVRRLVAINSGNYLFANIDLSKPVHLAAPNNRGKSTLVNSLQFLYIDDFTKMRFGSRSHEDTRSHYFGGDRSYLIFECLTTSGIQCLLVRGLSNLRGGQFERYVYEGPFLDSDYITGDGEIGAFDAVRTRLADRHLAQVKNSDLWQVLAGNLPMDDGKPIPRLSILPIRRREEYTAFRDVFVRLLSLSNVNAKVLRQLIIDSHAREVGEKKIDVAAEYKDEFDRAERSEHQLNFIRAVAREIDQGRTLRLDIQACADKFKSGAPLVWQDAVRCRRFMDADDQALSGKLAQMERDHTSAREERDQWLVQSGERKAALAAIDAGWEQLQRSHKKWSAYSPAFVKEMRERAANQAAEIAERAQHLEQAGRLDLDAMRRRVNDLERQLQIDRKAVEHWERTAIAELRRAGATDEQIESAFHIANPALLKLVIGEGLKIKDVEIAVERVRGIAARVSNGVFSDNAIEAELSQIAGPDLSACTNPQQLRRGIKVAEMELKQQQTRLHTAENQEKACAELERLRNAQTSLANELAEYDRYSADWSNRPALEQRLLEAKASFAESQQEVTKLKRRLESLDKERKHLEGERGELTLKRGELTLAAKELRKVADQVGLGTILSADDEEQPDESTRPKSVLKYATAVCGKLTALNADLASMASCRSELRGVQTTIADKSRQFQTQQRYFSDEDDEWNLLIDSLESLPQLENATGKSWDALFTTLRARLNAVVTAVSSIRNAVERLNRGMKAYQVSNLREVHIKVEEAHDLFSALEALASQGSLFQDRDAIDFAKKKLRQMIEANEIIDLESLFELRISIQQTDGTWRQASSLDEIGSTGTGMTAKAMIFIQLVRAIAGNERYRLHFYIDGLGELDDNNLGATAAMAVSKGIIPITADPRLHLEPLAHPDVTVYGLGQNGDGRFFVDSYKTYRAHRKTQLVGDGRE